MPTLGRAGRLLHFTSTGSGPGVVLVPGLGGGARQFGTLPRRFARAGFTCAAVDPVGLPPSGPLPASGFDFAAAAADVLAVAAWLPPPVALVGTSLGGKVALRAAAMGPGPVERLALLCSGVVISARARRVHRMFERLATAVDGRLLGDLLAPFLFGATFHARHAALVDDIVRQSARDAAARDLLRAQAAALLDYDGRGDAGRCPVPVLCLGGAEDTLTLPAEVEATAAALPRARCHVIASAGHSLLLESTAAFDALVAFLRDGAP
jgi:pimeloyl-ACP methyl ester carboxylesterase